MKNEKEYSVNSGVCLLLEDQTRTRDFLSSVVLSTFSNIKIVSLGNLREAYAWLDQRDKSESKEPLTLALIDLGLPDGSGVEIVRHLTLSDPEVRSIVVTIYDDDAHLFDALSAGADGYLLKDEGPEVLSTLLQRISTGEPPLSPAIAHRLIRYFRAPVIGTSEEITLTSRESETLALLAKGLTVAEAAKSLGLSAQTVAGYVKIIYQKLHVSNRAEATREAIRRGLA